LPFYLFQGWYIVTYALGIYHLNLLLAFLTPKIDPAMAEFEAEEADDGLQLPTSKNDEFRPFIRRLPEFKFWYSASKATLIAFICTFFEFFNIPVFWPILVMYFITLFCITMKRQIKVREKLLPQLRYNKVIQTLFLVAHDSIPLHPVHLWKTQVYGKGRQGEKKVQCNRLHIEVATWSAIECNLMILI
jgi:hypothetical protein